MNKIKKALVRTVIFDFIDENELKTIPDIINNLKALYYHLKNHRCHGNLLGDITLEDFTKQANEGLMIASVNQQLKQMRGF